MKYLKLFENFQTEITYEDVEDMLLDYIDSKDISMRELESIDSAWFFNLTRPNLNIFLRTYVTCLLDKDNFLRDPFESITFDTDLDEYFKVEKPIQNKTSKSIYFELEINKKLASKFLSESDSETKSALTNPTGGPYATILSKRFIFKILKYIFSKFLSFYKNIKIFYKVYDTWDFNSSENKPFAKIVFRIELPDETSSQITESIQKTDWSQVEFSNLGGFIGGPSKVVGDRMIKTDNNFIVKGWTEEELEKLTGLQYKQQDDRISVNDQKTFFYQEGGINILYKIDSDFDRYEVKDDKLYVYFKSGKEDVIDFRNPANESIQVKDFTSDFLDVDILDDRNNKIGSFQLESYDGKNYTIIDALIEEDYRMQGYYRKSIIELLNLHPKIVIVSVFRSEEAERAWKRLLETLPEGFHFTEKHHKEENTTEYKIFKEVNFEEVEKETFLSFEYETVDFPENELKTIQKISPEMKFTLDFYDTKNKIHFVTGYDKKSGKSIIIEKKEDGWYLVFQTQSYLDRPAMKYKKYFLCDQFDGLTELLEKYK